MCTGRIYTLPSDSSTRRQVVLENEIPLNANSRRKSTTDQTDPDLMDHFRDEFSDNIFRTKRRRDPVA